VKGIEYNVIGPRMVKATGLAVLIRKQYITDKGKAWGVIPSANMLKLTDHLSINEMAGHLSR
jgi:hypothetical protein